MDLPDKVSDWKPEWRELWAERVSIMLYEGNPAWVTRDEKSAIFERAKRTAEYLAELDIRKLVRQQ